MAVYRQARRLHDPMMISLQGVGNERFGELPRAFVVRISDDLTEQQVEHYVKGQVAKCKKLKKESSLSKKLKNHHHGVLFALEMMVASLRHMLIHDSFMVNLS